MSPCYGPGTVRGHGDRAVDKSPHSPDILVGRQGAGSFAKPQKFMEEETEAVTMRTTHPGLPRDSPGVSTRPPRPGDTLSPGTSGGRPPLLGQVM